MTSYKVLERRLEAAKLVLFECQSKARIEGSWAKSKSPERLLYHDEAKLWRRLARVMKSEVMCLRHELRSAKVK